ncbi:hypothetical protein CRP01_26300 [Flavilitoribacter nigricans DSM 23189 = NBRC 102662]|uniref:Uncharacterized protein n=1 Tax=Flavilitoribacter nigricans (strain ATCC 23147 / DSM 23189 / NBRC 102662 / NCIMB 1420 / SS-2) TaxID=1122177 RepID=A0A2D0N4T9_FLAN2|nr:hypothetical protein CRP01_26300 [Flavilitoribacter nigricans DSM 23189 = NBRC 102662]
MLSTEVVQGALRNGRYLPIVITKFNAVPPLVKLKKRGVETVGNIKFQLFFLTLQYTFRQFPTLFHFYFSGVSIMVRMIA